MSETPVDKRLGGQAETSDPRGMGAWFCIICEATGESVKFDLEARKHTDTTGHGTVTSHRDPVPLSACIDEVRQQLQNRRA